MTEAVAAATAAPVMMAAVEADALVALEFARGRRASELSVDDLLGNVDCGGWDDFLECEGASSS